MKHLFLITVFLSAMCQAQSWPTEPVRVIVNVAAGGDGCIGFDAVSRSDADGHTLLYSATLTAARTSVSMRPAPLPGKPL
jgi:tripartite-type tricarboxylate transporter receptor subunit TctC